MSRGLILTILLCRSKYGILSNALLGFCIVLHTEHLWRLFSRCEDRRCREGKKKGGTKNTQVQVCGLMDGVERVRGACVDALPVPAHTVHVHYCNIFKLAGDIVFVCKKGIWSTRKDPHPKGGKQICHCLELNKMHSKKTFIIIPKCYIFGPWGR